jgi:hypothetical protein
VQNIIKSDLSSLDLLRLRDFNIIDKACDEFTTDISINFYPGNASDDRSLDSDLNLTNNDNLGLS